MNTDKFVDEICGEICALVKSMNNNTSMIMCDRLIEEIHQSKKMSKITDDVLCVPVVPNFAYLLMYLEFIAMAEHHSSNMSFSELTDIVHTYAVNTDEGRITNALANMANIVWSDRFTQALSKALSERKEELCLSC